MDHCFLTLINGGGPLYTIQRLKAKCDEALSNCAFKFNLCRYTMDEVGSVAAAAAAAAVSVPEDMKGLIPRVLGRAVHVDPIKPKLKPPNNQRFKLK